MFDEGWVDLGPGCFEGGHAVGRDGDFAGLYSERGGRGGGVGRGEVRAGFFVEHCGVFGV